MEKYPSHNKEVAPGWGELGKGRQDFPPVGEGNALCQAMRDGRPKFEDFRGHPDYKDVVLDWDERRCRGEKARDVAASSTIKTGERPNYWVNNSEPLVAYLLNSTGLLPASQRFACLASQYDDMFNGTDVIFGVGNGKEKSGRTKFMAFSVDVTASMSEEIIKKKFDVSEQYNWLAEIKYCKREDRRWKELATPHFILGLAPQEPGLIGAIRKVRVESGILLGRDPDPKTDFKLLSEIYEQADLQIASLKIDPKKTILGEKLLKLQTAMLFGLCVSTGMNVRETLPFSEESRQEFEKRYQEKEEAARDDVVYRHIIDETRARAAKPAETEA